MTTGYIVKDFGYEEINEVYYKSDDGKYYKHGSDKPEKVYLDKGKAQEEVNRLNIEHIIHCEIGQYSLYLEDIINNIPDFESMIKKYDTEQIVNLRENNELSGWFVKNAPNFSQEDKEKLLEIVNLDFYLLIEVKIDNSHQIPNPQESTQKKKTSKLSI